MAKKKTKKKATKQAANIKRTKKKKKSVKQDKKIDLVDLIKKAALSKAKDSEDPPKKRAERPTRQADSPIYKTWPTWGNNYLKAYRTHYVQSLTCDAIHIHMTTLRRYMRGCKEFRDACDMEKHAITDLLEKSALHRAVHGTDEIFLFEGQPVYLVDQVTDEKSLLPLLRKKWETNLTVFMLKGRRREEYYPEQQGSGGTADDKAAAVREALEEITKVMAPPSDWDQQQDE